MSSSCWASRVRHCWLLDRPRRHVERSQISRPFHPQYLITSCKPRAADLCQDTQYRHSLVATNFISRLLNLYIVELNICEVKKSRSLNGTPNEPQRRVGLLMEPQSYGMSLTIWDYTVLSAIRHKWTHPAVTQPDRLVLDLPRWLVTYRDGLLDHRQSPIQVRPGVKFATCWSHVWRPACFV